MAAKKNDLTQLCPGFYIDAAKALYFDIKEFLMANGLPDAPELRLVILDEIRREYRFTRSAIDAASGLS